jgi:hypothetical protein
MPEGIEQSAVSRLVMVLTELRFCEHQLGLVGVGPLFFRNA